MIRQVVVFCQRKVADATCGREMLETLETLETLRGGCGAEVGSETGGLDAECSHCCALALWCHPGYRGQCSGVG